MQAILSQHGQEVFDRHGAAAFLDVSVQTFERLVKRGEVARGFKIGPTLRKWTRTMLMSYVQGQIVKANTSAGVV